MLWKYSLGIVREAGKTFYEGYLSWSSMCKARWLGFEKSNGAGVSKVTITTLKRPWPAVWYINNSFVLPQRTPRPPRPWAIAACCRPYSEFSRQACIKASVLRGSDHHEINNQDPTDSVCDTENVECNSCRPYLFSVWGGHVFSTRSITFVSCLCSMEFRVVYKFSGSWNSLEGSQVLLSLLFACCCL